ncbi:META domain-containing protein [Fulvivirga kasyanovii]|uniref:META domain-containing protein n=1 Tax=Fulvivirga kasyanovii TaxID=396812 RepID=A0ABW9S033_9BACT|nr:hypothetical protein [Fulvivirga kasyanovii]MTI29059.1 hypothetical protein [Fulvivirga kasyanovii]
MNLLALSILLLFLDSPASNLSGNWTALHYKDSNQLICHQRAGHFQPTLIFTKEVLIDKSCNEFTYSYSINDDIIKLEHVSPGRTLMGCPGLRENVEDLLSRNSTFKHQLTGDTLYLIFNNKEELKLMRTESLDMNWYDQYYREIGCKWPDVYYSISKDSIHNEPIHYFAEVFPTSCNDDPQKIIDQNIKRTARLERLDANEKLVLRFPIDKYGKLHVDLPEQEYPSIYKEEILRLLKLLPHWEPAKIDDEPVNMYYPLIFDFRKAEE